MYTQPRATKTTINCNTSYVGETLEEKIQRIINNKEPIRDGSPAIYTERKDGVMPSYNIRTDRWDVAIEAMDKVSQSHIAKRAEKAKAQAELIKDIEGGKIGD